MRSATTAPTDLADALSRASAGQDRMTFHVGDQPGEGWHNCAEFLATEGAFDAWRADLAAWMTGRYGAAPARTTAGYVLAWYTYLPAYLGALLFHHERRVPSLRPEDLAFRLATPRPHPDATALLSHEFACLPDDPAAGTPGTTVVGSLADLAALLRERYAAHAARFVAAYGPGVRFGRHTLWAGVTDALDNSLLLAGRHRGDEGGAVADAAMVLPAKLAPFTTASTMRTDLDAQGNTCWTRRRESCCFAYLLAPAERVCATCPRVLPKA